MLEASLSKDVDVEDEGNGTFCGAGFDEGFSDG
jgi:hypothetical protein